MPELDFRIEGVEPAPHAATPQLAFKLRITQRPEEGTPPAPIHNVLLRCQVRLDPARRRYAPAEQERLVELFGEPRRWGQTVRSSLWAQLTLSVPGFDDQTAIDLLVPCTFDFTVAATKYFAALDEQGDVPLSFLFSGTIFYAGEDGSLQVEQISWEKEAAFRLPVQAWRRMMDLYYPNTAWLCLRRDVFDGLNRYKVAHAIPTWERAIESLLDEAGATLAIPDGGEVSP